MVLFGSFWGSFGYPCNCLSPLLVEEKAISCFSKLLAIACPLCLSRERQFQGMARTPKSVPFRMILDTSSGFSRSRFPLACRRKGCFRAPRACSRWPFPPACREPPKVFGELLKPKNTTIVNNCSMKLALFWLGPRSAASVEASVRFSSLFSHGSSLNLRNLSYPAGLRERSFLLHLQALNIGISGSSAERRTCECIQRAIT